MDAITKLLGSIVVTAIIMALPILFVCCIFYNWPPLPFIILLIANLFEFAMILGKVIGENNDKNN